MPQPFDEAFLADLPYDPEVLLFDEIIEIDHADNRVICRMPTDRPLPFTVSQRAHPVRHPRHVAGGTLVHASGMLGFVHAYYLHGMGRTFTKLFFVNWFPRANPSSRAAKKFAPDVEQRGNS